MNFINNEIKRIAGNIGLSFALRVIGKALSYFFFLQIARNYGAASSGKISLYFTILQLCLIISLFGMDLYVVQKIPYLLKLKGKYYTAKWSAKVLFIVLLLSFFMSLIIYLCWYFNTLLLTGDKLFVEVLYYIAITLTPFSIVHIISAIFRGNKYSNIFTICVFIFIYLFGNIFIYADGYIKLTSNIFNIVILSVYCTFIATFILLKNKKIISLIKPKKLGLLSTIKESYPFMIINSLFTLLTWGNVIVLGIYVKDAQIGIYDICTRLGLLLIFPLQTITVVLAPLVSEMYILKKISQLRRIAIYIPLISFVTSLPVFLLFIFYHNKILGMFGPEFIYGTNVLIIISVGRQFNSLTGFLSTMMSMMQYEKVLVKLGLACVFLNFIISFIIIPRYGILGAAYVNAGVIFLLNCACVIVTYKLIEGLKYKTI